MYLSRLEQAYDKSGSIVGDFITIMADAKFKASAMFKLVESKFLFALISSWG